MVNGVTEPSGFSRTIEMCSFSRTIRNPRDFSALQTFFLGASTGNLAKSGLHPSLRHKCFQHRGINLQRFCPEAFQVKLEG